METIINHIHISNFKSLKDVTLDQCRRINLIIGKPNVGKSNLLEAMSLFCLPYLKYTRKKHPAVYPYGERCRVIFDGHVDSPISVKTNKVNVEVKMDNMGLLYSQTNPAHPAQDVAFTISNLTIPAKKNIDIPTATTFKCYLYPPAFDKEKLPIPFLLPPGGSNLMNIVSMMPKLKEELRTIFNDYGLKYVFDTNSQEIKVMKEKKPGEIFLIPFHSIADTLQRMIFYKAAIESNSESALVFEEPEAHSYPPFISKVTQDIIQSDRNQFFITTHSPYVVNDFLELPSDELAIYLVDFRNGETFVKRASDTEIQEMYEYGIDLFFNTETFLR